jgi:hypothetical protein
LELSLASIHLNLKYARWEDKNMSLSDLFFLGKVSGPLSSVWKEWVKWCVEFGIEANAIIAVPYDWRLPPSMLEERDLYFHKLKYVTLDIFLCSNQFPQLIGLFGALKVLPPFSS